MEFVHSSTFIPEFERWKNLERTSTRSPGITINKYKETINPCSGVNQSLLKYLHTPPLTSNMLIIGVPMTTETIWIPT